MDLEKLLEAYRGQNYDLHRRYLNPQLPEVLRVLGFDKCYEGRDGAYILDLEGRRYLDLLSGYGVFNVGRHHPKVVEVVRQALELSLPNMVHFECSLLGGILAKRLCDRLPSSLDRVFFCNSGAESVEAAIKFARRHTGRNRLLRCRNGFHGLTTGALSLNGSEEFRRGFGRLLEVEEVVFNDVEDLERKLGGGDFAAFFMEVVQGKTLEVASEEFLQTARRLCTQTGTLLVLDEVQTGFGRTGRMFAFEHYEGVVPDILCLAKALSGGLVPVGAMVSSSEVFASVFDGMDSCMVHSSTFSQNTLAMAAGLATLEVLEEEGLAQRAWELGEYFFGRLEGLVERYEMLAQVRGRGLMVGLVFDRPQSLGLRMGWNMLSKVKGLFGQLIVIPLMRDYGILTQVAGHNNVVKLLPPLTIEREDLDLVVEALDGVLSSCHSFPGGLWELGKTLLSLGRNTLRR